MSDYVSDTPVHRLFSPEGVRLELPVAGPAPRMFAYAVDFVIIVVLLVAMLITLVAVLPVSGMVDKWAHQVFHEAAQQINDPTKPHTMEFGALAGVLIALFVLAQFIVETGYFIFWEMVTNGRSPGKMLTGLRVVRRDGMPIDLRSSTLRNLMRIVDILPEYYVVGLVSILLSPGGERLGDHVAGTIVIRLDRPHAAPEIEVSRNGSLALTRAQLARIGPPELQLIRATLRRIADLSEARRTAIVDEVANAMKARLEMDGPEPTDAQNFLRELLAVAERYHRGAD